MRFTREDLRELALLDGLPDEQLDWFCEHGERVVLATGAHMFERGQPATSLWLVVKGVIQGFEEIGGQWLLVATTERGQVTGMLPFSRMTHYPRYTVAVEPSEVLRLDAAHFREMIDVSHEVARRLVAEMSDRVRGDVRLEQHSEKMMALGRLSAGLAHELNNPAAAARRAAARLREQQARHPELVTSLIRLQLTEPALRELERLLNQGTRAALSRSTPLELSESEDRLTDWLEAHGLDQAWDVAGGLASAGLTPEDLEPLADSLPAEALPTALRWLGGALEADRILEEIGQATGRISGLIDAIKSYSHMDRSREHKPTDVRKGLDGTLTMLGHKLKGKSIRVERDYEDGLPSIPANAGELNQVWTNLIDNAVDAMEGGGTLLLSCRLRESWLEVEIVDDGPGIPEQIRARIFEPFFTTKDVGVGTGLGLGIADRIVKTHRGHIEVRSEPGRTVMCVRLPAH